MQSAIHTLRLKKEQVAWNDTWDCYFWKSPRKMLTGITKLLKKRFYPRVTKLNLEKSKTKTASKHLLKGKKGGKLVHEQLRDLVEASKTMEGLAAFKRKCRVPDPRVRAVMKEVISREWNMLYSEYIVADKEHSLGTAVDMVCIDKQDRIAIIEIKTDSCVEDYCTPHPSTMKEPMNNLDRSKYGQHQLQLLATYELFKRFTGIQPYTCEVWVLGAPENMLLSVPPRIFPLHPEITSKSSDVIDFIAAFRLNKRKRS